MDDRPDIEIGAVVRAKRLRFHKKPQAEVHVEAEPGHGESRSERENLPETVEPGVTYRNVLVGWRAAAKLDPKQGDDDG